MKVVFMGTPATAVPSLDAVVRAGHRVQLVVTQPDRPSGRSRTPRPPPVKERAHVLGLPVVQPEKVRGGEFVSAISEAAPDVIVVVAYGRILTRAVLDAAPHGAVNLHFSLLPAYRGAAPVQWALARGDDETGVTTFRIDEGLDTGAILSQSHLVIPPGERAPALLARLADEGADLLVATLTGLSAGSLESAPQDEARATFAPLLRREDGDWDPAWTARDLAGRVRGFDPWPGVWAARAGRRLRIVDAVELPGPAEGGLPGVVLALDGPAVLLACAEGTVVSLASVQPEGGRPMSAREAVNGRLLSPGDRLEPPKPAA